MYPFLGTADGIGGKMLAHHASTMLSVSNCCSDFNAQEA